MRPWRAVAFQLGAWVTLALSLYAAFFAFKSFFLVPDNIRLTMIRNWTDRLEITGIAVITLLALLALAYFCFVKCDECRKR